MIRGCTVVVAAGLAAACYSPPSTARCEVQCAAASEACPEGLSCVAGYCMAPGDTGSCDGAIDAGADAPPDGAPPGAALSGLAAGAFHTCGIDAERQLWCWGENSRGQLGVAVDASVPVRPEAVEVVVSGVTGWKQVAAGTRHTCAIDDADELFCWGDDGYGQLGRDYASGAFGAPDRVDDDALEGDRWDRVIAGGAHTCGLRTGRLFCWGADAQNQLGDNDDVDKGTPVRIGTDTDWIEVVAESANTCGVRDTATGHRLYCWGRPEILGDAVPGTQYGLPDKEIVHPDAGEGRRFGTAAIGDTFACAIDDLADLWCWGSNYKYQQGDASGDFVPSLSDATRDWDEIHAWSERACGRAGTEVYCWGGSDYGEAGVRADSSVRGAALAGSWAELVTGQWHTCGVTTAGEAQCWGENSRAQLGTGEIGDGLSPRQVAPGTAWSRVTAGYTSTCAIAASDSAIWCWGIDTYGVLGAPGDSAVPRRLDALGTGWKRVATIGWHACAIDGDDHLWCWGAGGHGQLGTSTDVGEDPTQIGTATWRDVAVGDRHTCAIASDGTLWCWGGRNHGVLGDGSVTDQRDTPLQITTVVGEWDQVASGPTHVCATRSDGGAACWGWNMWNQVDESATVDITTPDPIATPATGWTSVVPGGEYYTQTCGLVGDAAYCWGIGQDGRLGLPDTSGRSSPTALTTPAATGWEAISPGGAHGCALRDAGQLWCWGGLHTLPLGNGRLEESLVPVRVGAAAGWKDVDTGTYHSCAIDADDAIWCWGDNSQLQLGAGLGHSATPQPVTAVPAR